MTRSREFSRLILPLGTSVCLSLFGDLSLYAVLPSRRGEVGLTLAAVGVMLSVNRLIRIPANPVAGVLFDRRGRRRLFILGMALGVLSTASYALMRGFWPFLASRLVWGIAWLLISVGGRAMVLDISTELNRGRVSGYFNLYYLLGLALGPFVGGVLVDRIGFRLTMLTCAGLTTAGLLVAVLALPETLAAAAENPRPSIPTDLRRARRPVSLWREAKALLHIGPGLVTVSLLHFITLFAGEGVVLSTVSMLLQDRLGQELVLGTLTMPVATASGALLAWMSLVSGTAGTLMGHLSDIVLGRRLVIVGSLIAGALGYSLLALGSSLGAVAASVTLAAVSTGAMGATLLASLGSETPEGKEGVVVGAYSAVGDIGSTAGPLVAFALASGAGLRWAYALCAGGFLAALGLGFRCQDGRTL